MERKAQTPHFVFAVQFDIIVAFIAIRIRVRQTVGVCACVFLLANRNCHVTLDMFPVIFHADCENVAQRASEHVNGLRKVMCYSFV